MQLVQEILKSSVVKYKNKPYIIDEKGIHTYNEVHQDASSLSQLLFSQLNQPIIIYIDRGFEAVCAMFGILYSGNYYAVIDTKWPTSRIFKIIHTISPSIIVTTRGYQHIFQEFDIECIFIDELTGINIERIEEQKICDMSPAYITFTSGSTGTPKGVVTSHKSLMDYISWVNEEFSFHSDTLLGNQAPFCYVNSILDIYGAAIAGGCLAIIPERYFSFPKRLIKYIKEHEVNTIFWVPSVLSMVADANVFEEIKAESLHTILFCGEAMPVKQLNYWRKHYNNAVFANLYGASETTDAVCFYRIYPESFLKKSVPIGIPRKNVAIAVIKEDGTAAQRGEKGELYISGTCLAQGYYREVELTDKVFIQNPMHNYYIDRYYRTGDIVEIGKAGEMTYLCRNDYQIKHMGHRIELGEIEYAASSILSIERCCAIYDEENHQIILCYQRSEELPVDEIRQLLKNELPRHMLPSKYVYNKKFPYNNNKKLDRKKILADIQNQQKHI